MAIALTKLPLQALKLTEELRAPLPKDQSRLLWYARYSRIPIQKVQSLWKVPHLIHKEMRECGEVDPDAFAQVSHFLGLHLLREEARRFPYYRRLRSLLRSMEEVDKERRVLFLGPTSGAEIEVIAAIATPVLCAPFGKSLFQAEERLLEDRVDFESLCFETGELLEHQFVAVVLSHWLPDAVGMAKLAYDVAASNGYLICPSDCTVALDELDLAGMPRLGVDGHEAVLLHKPSHLPAYLSTNLWGD